MVDILPHWNWEIHKSYQQVVDKYEDILVGVYSNALSVEIFQWKIPERKDLSGKRFHLVEDRVVAVGKLAKIGLRSERSQLDVYGQDLLYLYLVFWTKMGTGCQVYLISFIFRLKNLPGLWV